jgi:hypothetical protein
LTATQLGLESYASGFGFATAVSSEGVVVISNFGNARVYVFSAATSYASIVPPLQAVPSDANDFFGFSVAISADGATIVVGAPQEDSNATGIGGNANDNSLTDSGAVYIYSRNATGDWPLVAYVKSLSSTANALFGYSVSVNEDGSVIAIGSPGDGSSTTGIVSPMTTNARINNLSPKSGSAFVLSRSASRLWSDPVSWTYVKASNAEAGDQFGFCVSLCGNGKVLAVGAPFEDSDAIGVNGNQTNNNVLDSGAAYVFQNDGNGPWTQNSYVKSSDFGVSGNQFGAPFL